MRTINQNTMVGEDFRSQAAMNVAELLKTRIILNEKSEIIENI